MGQGFEEERDLEEKIKMTRATRYYTQAAARKALPKERVAMCLRSSQNKQNVQVWKHRDSKRAFFDGLMVCGSVWNCPVCSAKISERRRKELQTAFEMHRAEGGEIALLTLTFSHKKRDKLEEILNTFSKATQKFMTGKAFQRIREELGMIGRVRAMEVTYSEQNGFHPHVHIAILYTNKVDLKMMEEKMYVLWEKATSKVGLTINRKHGLSLEGGEEANDYISKHGQWGMDHELSKAHVKKGKNGSLMPFDFLRNYLATEDEKYLFLFKQYAEAFKGKRQLQWSQGLKKRFQINEKSDDELAHERTEMADLLGLIDLPAWKEILKQNQRPYVLDLCEKYSFEKAMAVIESINKKNQSSNSEL